MKTYREEGENGAATGGSPRNLFRDQGSRGVEFEIKTIMKGGLYPCSAIAEPEMPWDFRWFKMVLKGENEKLDTQGN